MNCNTTNIIYVHLPIMCKEEHIGETGEVKLHRYRVNIYMHPLNQHPLLASYGEFLVGGMTCIPM